MGFAGFLDGLPAVDDAVVKVEVIAERVARNQSAFRDANEGIEKAAERIAHDGDGVEASEPFPFICECPDERCSEIARLSLVDYEVVRSRGEWFLAAPGHEVCVVDGQHIAKIVRRNDAYSLMEKVGRAAEFADALDPRSPA